MNTNEIKEIFNKAYTYAMNNSTCMKVKVGSACLVDNTLITACNCSIEDSKNCIKLGECYKYKITGIYESCEETRKYCSAIHSEINLINRLKTLGFEVAMPTMTLFVTRYPCENCAKNIVDFGFKKVYYCGKQEISDEVKKIFKINGIDYKWYPEFDFEY